LVRLVGAGQPAERQELRPQQRCRKRADAPRSGPLRAPAAVLQGHAPGEPLRCFITPLPHNGQPPMPANGENTQPDGSPMSKAIFKTDPSHLPRTSSGFLKQNFSRGVRRALHVTRAAQNRQKLLRKSANARYPPVPPIVRPSIRKVG
jgi:hypothetical protein